MTQETYKDLFVLDDNKFCIDDLFSLSQSEKEPYVADREALERSERKNQEILTYSMKRLEEIMSEE